MKIALVAHDKGRYWTKSDLSGDESLQALRVVLCIQKHQERLRQLQRAEDLLEDKSREILKTRDRIQKEYKRMQLLGWEGTYD